MLATMVHKGLRLIVSVWVLMVRLSMVMGMLIRRNHALIFRGIISEYVWVDKG